MNVRFLRPLTPCATGSASAKHSAKRSGGRGSCRAATRHGALGSAGASPSRKPPLLFAPATLCALCLCSAAFAQNQPPVPHGQSKPPGPALSPAEAIARMTVPEGFTVELVAAEPDIVNPVAMTFDERGRIWITESLEYPRLDAGPGRDRVKVLEDTDGDGRADRFTIFADGLNIPSGIAVGAGGVWVANSPDILFMQDTDGDGRADRREVVVTGFGRDDVHELPNSLTWGPDGWLYGLNGVFNRSRVEQDGREYRFTAAMFRIHPRTRRFELFAEGTSNPWGIAWDAEGSAFVSACVIDHLWHLTQTGYYHRQAGAYPPFTWKIESIVKHAHQQAAYCGIHYFDSDAYPAEYRGKLYMGNIHGNCVNCDALSRDGSTYVGEAQTDFLSANDAWFMPVVQKTGPDGCLYVLDWYDRYHCYQDARRDPQGIDRGRGRLYRVRYHQTPRAGQFDLAKESGEQLIARLASGNVFFRDAAQRLLWERNAPRTREQLARLVLDDAAPRSQRMHALWALVGCGPLDAGFHAKLLSHADAGFRGWGVRAAAGAGEIDASLRRSIVALARDPSPDVRLQVAIAATRIEGLEPMELLVDVLAGSDGDRLIPHIVWQNLHPRLEQEGDRFVAALAVGERRRSAAVALVVPRAVERLLACAPLDAEPVARLMRLYLDDAASGAPVVRLCLAQIAAKIESREIAGENLDRLRKACQPLLAPLLAGSSDGPLYLDAALVAVAWNDPAGVAAVRRVLASARHPDSVREQALAALIAARDPELLATIEALIVDEQCSVELRRRTLATLSRLDDDRVADVVLANWRRIAPELHAQGAVLLSSRTSWSRKLLAAIGERTVDSSVVNANQAHRMMLGGDEELRRQAKAIWGATRTERDPAREQAIARIRQAIRRSPGDAAAGQAVFHKVCGNCHKIYGQGQDVGPDITVNGRGSFEQLLSNVLDPSLVIGAAYQARTVVTDDGRILTGLAVEDGPQRVVLKQQGGKLETIPRDDIAEMETSKLSLMPEDLEKQLKPDELMNLFAFLALDRPPDDPAARRLPGTSAPEPREATDPDRFADIVAEVAPGFAVEGSGTGGVAIVAEHRGRAGVLRTHPIGPKRPCVLEATIDVPEGRKTRLIVEVSHHAEGDWRFVARANGRSLAESDVSPKTAPDGWLVMPIDLTRFAGEKVAIELVNQATGWQNEFAFWGRVELVSD
ncbi:MAG: c-type cytochrome [Planctomycetia bacterium]|nr:c-type cytochrome [Planctomycetia bacterium]